MREARTWHGERRHGARPGDPGRPRGRRAGRRARGGGRRRRRRHHHRRRGGAGPGTRGDRRRRPARHARVRRHPHPLRRPGHVGLPHDPLELARRDDGRDGQLRRRLRAGAPRRARPADLAHGGRRGHPRRGARRGHRLDVGELRRIPRRRRAAPPRHRPVRAAPPRRAAPLRHGGAGRPPGGCDGGGRGGHAQPGDRGHAGRRHRVLDVAHAEPPHGEWRPDAVAAGAGRRARGHRAAAWPTPGTASSSSSRTSCPTPTASSSSCAAWWRARACRSRCRWRRATASPRRGGACWPGSRRRWPRACPSGPRWRRAPVGLLVGLQSSYHPFSRSPPSREIAGLPVAEQARALRDPTFRARLLAELPDDDRDGGRRSGRRRLIDYARLFPLGEVPDYEPPPERERRAHGRRPGRRPRRAHARPAGRGRRAALPLHALLQLRRREPRRLRRDAGASRHRLRPGRRRGARGPHRRRQLPHLLPVALGPRPRPRPHAGRPGRRAADQLDGTGGRPARTAASWPRACGPTST